MATSDEPRVTAARGTDHPAMSDEAIEAAGGLIGRWLRRDVHWSAQYEPLSLHDIRRFAIYSVGDDNPLFADVEYGKGSRYGSNVAPPTFLYNVDSTIVGPGLPGIQWIHGGNRWRFHRVVRPGDTITAKARLIKVERKRGARAATMVIQTGETLFHNQRDELVARAECDILRIPRRGSGEGLSLGGSAKDVRISYTPDQIEEISEAYRNEHRQGSEPLYGEDIAVGDDLPRLVKGPLTLVDIVGFYSGRRYTYNVLKLAFEERERHPRNVYVSPSSGIPMHPAAGHFDHEIAHEVGMPTAYDQGWMRINWSAHLLTSWMGDHGDLLELDIRNVSPNFLTWTAWCSGTVTSLEPTEGGRWLAEVAIRVENQDDKVLSEGRASVSLPGRRVD
jgi:acyl dehydratase